MRKWKHPKKMKNWEQLSQATGLSGTAIQILYNRGIDTVEEIKKFLSADFEDLLNVYDMKHVTNAIAVIEESIDNDEHIVIYCDYDNDGANAAIVGKKCLEKLGLKVSIYMNDRFSQGYGLNPQGIDEILKKWTDVKTIITVDNGITAFEGAQYAIERGLKLVITDHHEPKSSFPLAYAIVNPKRKDQEYACPYLCGAGVIWKVMLALYEDLDRDTSFVFDQLDIVALATVGDVVPLIGENRILVKKGLELINLGKRMQFKVLKEMLGITEVDAHNDLAFKFVPMMNAVGRLQGNMYEVIDFFMETDEEKARIIAENLIRINEERKALTDKQYALAESLITDTEDIVLIVKSDHFHEGIIGLIAGRLKEKYNRPTFVFKQESDGTLKGSSRSINGFHVKNALDELQELLKSYGGHDMAAGLSLDLTNFKDFTARIKKLANESLTEEMLVKTYFIDAHISIGQLNEMFVDQIKRLEPFGAGFSQPNFMLMNIPRTSVSFIGKMENHLKINVGRTSIIGWNQAENYKNRESDKSIRCLGYPAINEFNNTRTVQFIINEDNFM